MARSKERLPELRIEALGPPRVLLGGVPVTFARHKALALLVYLAVSGRAHARGELAALLSDAAGEEEARGQLRSTLRDLRRAVGEHLAVGRDVIGLAPDRPV